MSGWLQHLLSPGPSTRLDLANHLWQSTVVGGGMLILIAACRRLSAATRRTLGWIGLAKFVLPMAWIVSVLKSLPPSTESHLNFDWPNLTVPVPPALFISSAAAAPERPVYPILITLVWLAGGAGLAAYWLVQGWRVRRTLRLAGPVSRPVHQRFAHAAARLGLRRPPPCRSVAADFGPGVLGVFSPVILVPSGLENVLDRDEFESVAIHEIIHWRRRDNLWGALQAAVVAAFWFNPVVWLLHRSLRIEAEKSCDERVLALIDSPETYAVGIAKTVRQVLGLAPMGLAGMATAPVVARIENILAPRAGVDRRAVRWAALAAGIVLVAFSHRTGGFVARPLAVIATSQPAEPPPALAQTVADEDWGGLPSAGSNLPPRSGLEPSLSPKRVEGNSPPAKPSAVRPTPQSNADASVKSFSVPPIQPAVSELETSRPQTTAKPGPAAMAATEPARAAPARPPIQPIIYQVNQLDQAPQAISEDRPSYPNGVDEPMTIEASVTVAFVVNPAGRVIGARIRGCSVATAHSSLDFDPAGHGTDSDSHRPAESSRDYAHFREAAAQFEAAAVAAVKRWSFRPGVKAGQPVYLAMAVVIGFAHTFEAPSTRAAAVGRNGGLASAANRISDEYQVFIPKL